MNSINTDTELNRADDSLLVEEIKRGNVEVFGRLMKKYNQRLYRIALSYQINNDDCDELLQRTYIAAYQNLDSFKGSAKFSSWLIKILINECLMYKRKKKTFKSKLQLLFSDAKHIENIRDGNSPQKLLEDTELKSLMENKIENMPEKYRVVFVMKEIEGMSLKEISESIGITEENAKIRAHRAKKLFKDFFEAGYKNLFSFGNERCDKLIDEVMKKIKNLNTPFHQFP